VINPIVEEFLYLGFVTNLLRGRGALLAISAGVAVRAVLHVYQGLPSVAAVSALGVVFGGYYFRTRRLWAVIFAHSLFDAVALARLSWPMG
jgi:membrane protease YdiL (CAAX protease family)